MNTLVDLLRNAAERYGDRPALTSHVGLRTRSWSYNRLWNAANALAHHFRDARSLAPGTPVVFWEQNSPELVAAFFGAMNARLILVPVDPSATPGFVKRVAAVTHAGLIVAPSAVVSGTGIPSVALTDLPFDRSHAPLQDPPTPDEIAEIVFTSGTTGRPKGVVLLHRNITANVEAALDLIPRQPLQLISLLPLSHMFEQTVGLYGPLTIGSTIHYPGSRRAPAIAKTIRRNRINAIVAVPRILELMMHNIEQGVTRRRQERRWENAHVIAPHIPLQVRRLVFRRVHRSLGGRLRYVICGGARLPAELAASWERMGIRVVEGYGTTECSPIVAANTYWERRHGTVGRPLARVEVDISADGEILVKGPNVFPGYWHGPEATAEVLDEHGWYPTGDLGFIDAEGHLVITGRRSDRIVLSSGLNVYPEDVERELREEPEIADCVVVGVQDAGGNTTLRAVVIPQATNETADESVTTEAAMRRAATRLAPHQRPTGVSMWTEPDFPRTNLGKVKRFEVEEAERTAAFAAPRPDGEAALGAVDTSDRLRNVLARVAGIDPHRIHQSSSLSLDLGLDSLGLLELAVALEDELGVVVENGDVARVGSVGELRDLVSRDAEPLPVRPPPDWPRAPWSRWLRDGLQQALLFPVHRSLADPFVVEGLGAFDRLTGPVLIVANHCSHADTPSVLRALPRRIRRRTMVAAAADYFYKWKPIGALMTLTLGTFPFAREGSVRPSLERCGEFADDGWSLLIYPEGTRSVTGELGPFRRGIGLLATQLDIPVIPIGIAGTYAMWPKGHKLPTSGPVTVRIGSPLEVHLDDDPTNTVERLESAVAALI